MEWKLFINKLLKKERHTAHIILKEDNKYLLVQEAIGGIRGLWGLPGGGIDKGETPELAAKREVQEETGFNVELLKSLGKLNDKKRRNIRHIFLAKIIDGQLRIDKSEHMDAKWMTLEEIMSLEDKLRGAWVLEAIHLSNQRPS